ncbi:MAG: TAT-variant-translocated molybdopterin oxidoreductase [Bacteroidetes bacterium]|nr:TAT-variant-translocated molybdopterin oxidoreductase [Bacteroidota bacterium]MBP6720718.1 TAT-variant-translocated molybdopterin oxidoreductase [Bacteroidia bacterium]
MGKNETYWNGLEQYQAEPGFGKDQKDEFSEDLPIGEALSEESLGFSSNRRDFLKLFGFGLTAAAITACVKAPVNKAIPYVVKPENVTPGVASWYATTCQGCAANCGLLVKSREGRPIKVEGNDLHALSKGGTCAVGQATILNLYDSDRLKAPKGPQGATTWDSALSEIKTKLDGVKASGGKVYLVSNTLTSPTSKKVIEGFSAQYPGAKHVVYDTTSFFALASAHNGGGSHWLPSFNFAKADVIVSIDADFLGNWISPVQFTKDYISKRKVTEENPTMSRHIHFESRLSLTGSNADLRVPMKPSALYGAVSSLYKKIVGGNGVDFDAAGNAVNRAAIELKKAGPGKALVICGINDVAVQSVVKAINEALGSYGSTIDVAVPSYQAQGNDVDMIDFMNNVGTAGAVIFLDEANPVYDAAGGTKFGEALAKHPLTISFNSKENETSQKCKYVLAQTHYLEAWDDANPVAGHYSLQQPLVRPIHGSRQWQDILLGWTEAAPAKKYYDYLKWNWETTMYPTQSAGGNFRKFWEGIVRNGYFTNAGAAVPVAVEPEDSEKPKAKGKVKANEEVVEAPAPIVADVSTHLETVNAAFNKGKAGLELVVYEKNYMRGGRYGNNPWIQEMPDPITKVTWDNYVSIPYGWAMSQNIKDGDKLKVTANGYEVTLPAIVQPGQANDSIAIALGWGRADIVGKVSKGVGANAAPFISAANSQFQYHSAGVTIAPTGENIEMAKTQTYIGYDMVAEGGHSKREQIEGRISDFITKETTLAEYVEHKSAGNKRPSPHHMISLWDIHDKKGHHWAMAIDLNACTGCGTCIVSCNAENNIATVGRDEVRRRREMHWMRIDRYFKGDPDAQDGSLQVLHQPMLCQHCDNAPCESVCPVLATTHSDEGLNQQIYNRCVGTRYCANNCPYKVRRFNWFSYYWNDKFKDVNPTQHDKVGRLVLNPDVTVRARGVMEKCSFCVQRIQEKKLVAKTEMRNPHDGEIKTACQQSCPADAIVFGDLNDENSEINKLFYNKRGYHALEDVKTLPKVLYLTKVRNTEKSAGTPAHAEGHGEPA